MNLTGRRLLRRSRPGADVEALDAELDAMRRDLELLQQYATQDAVHVDGITVAAQCAAAEPAAPPVHALRTPKPCNVLAVISRSAGANGALVATPQRSGKDSSACAAESESLEALSQIGSCVNSGHGSLPETSSQVSTLHGAGRRM